MDFVRLGETLRCCVLFCFIHHPQLICHCWDELKSCLSLGFCLLVDDAHRIGERKGSGGIIGSKPDGTTRVRRRGYFRQAAHSSIPRCVSRHGIRFSCISWSFKLPFSLSTNGKTKPAKQQNNGTNKTGTTRCKLTRQDDKLGLEHNKQSTRPLQ